MSNTDGKTGSSFGREPKVSVIIPCYNATRYITEALDSVFAQTFKDFEVIVINDGSPDTEQFERAIQPYLNRIVYIKQENRGPSAARNAGIHRARGEFIAFLDSDDGWLPDYLDLQMRLFEEKPSLDLICSDAHYFDDSGRQGIKFLDDCKSKDPATFQSLVMEESHIVTSGVIARRAILIEAGLFDESLFRAEDYDLWLRVAHLGGEISYQRKAFARHRLNPEGLASVNAKMLEGVVQVLAKLEKTLPVSPGNGALIQKQLGRAKANFEREQGKDFMAAGDFDRAKDSLLKADAFFHSAKLKLTILGLQIAPRLTRLFAITRERSRQRSRISNWSPEQRSKVHPPSR